MDAERLAPLVRVTFVKAIGTIKPPPPSCMVPLRDTPWKVIPLMVTLALPSPLPMMMVEVPIELPAKHGMQFRA